MKNSAMSFSLKKVFRWKIIIVFNLALLFFFGFNFTKEFIRNRRLNSEIKKLEAMAKEAEAKNLDILDLAKYLDTEQFLETEARTKLGLKKPGEEAMVVNIPDIATATGTEAGKKNEISNAKKWWRYFFGKRNN